MSPSHAAPDSRLSTLGSLIADTDVGLRRGEPIRARVWPTGFDILDRSLTGGIRSGELALLGGPHGQGKTTLGLQIVRNVVAAGLSAVVFSYEHEASTLLDRLISLEATTALGDRGVTVHAARRALELAPAGASLEEVLGALPGGAHALEALTAYGERLHVHESSGATTTLDEVVRVIERVRDNGGQVPLVLLDYLQKVPTPGVTDEVAQTTTVAEGLKDIALRLGLPVVAIAAADKESLGSGHRMRTHDLRGSSALAYEADVVLIINDKQDVVSREHLVYDLGNIDRFRNWSVLALEKNRHGAARIEMEFAKDFEHGRFSTQGGLVTERLIDERVFTT